MSAPEMPEKIYAWQAELVGGKKSYLSGAWGAERFYTDDALPYLRADLVEAQRAECVEVLSALGLIADSVFREGRLASL